MAEEFKVNEDFTIRQGKDPLVKLNADGTITLDPTLTMDSLAQLLVGALQGQGQQHFAVVQQANALILQQNTMLAERDQIIEVLKANHWQHACLDSIAVWMELGAKERDRLHITTRIVTAVLDSVARVAKRKTQ